MRNPLLLITFILLISLCFLGEKVFADAPENNCTQCWINCRDQIKECQNIPQSEIEVYQQSTQNVLNKTNFPLLTTCLCALSNKTDSILAQCNCSSQFAEGMKYQGELVAKELCVDSATVQNVQVAAVSSSGSGSSTTASLETGTSSVTAAISAGGTSTPTTSSASSIVLTRVAGCILILLASLFNI